jgi:hypothetical protein
MGGRVEAAHVVGRRHRTTRWGLANARGIGPEWDSEYGYDLCGHCLCHRCHQQYDEHGPAEQDIINVVVGQERKERLQFIARTSIAKHQSFEEIKSTLESMIPQVKDPL